MLLNQRDRRVPGEFEHHKGTYLLWPNRPDNWRDAAKHAQAAMVRLANLLAAYEPVTLGLLPSTKSRFIRDLAPNIRLIDILYDDIWIRDTGPIVVLSDEISCTAVDFRFNSWGGLFSCSENDDAVAERIANFENLKVDRSDIILEGGAIVTDGLGTFIATEEAILAPNRNPNLNTSDIEEAFRKLLNCEQMIWLPRGLADDESGGHVDNLCAFVDASTLLVADTDDPNHPSYDRVKSAQAILRQSKNLLGHSYQLIRVPLPPPTHITAEEARGFSSADGTIVREEGAPLAPSYLNIYVANGVVIVPTFDCETDPEALSIIANAFESRQAIAFPSREFLLGGGAVHCVTKDIPDHCCAEKAKR